MNQFEWFLLKAVTPKGDDHRGVHISSLRCSEVSIDWFSREKLQENPIFHGKIHGFLMFPVDFPLSQPIESWPWNRAKDLRFRGWFLLCRREASQTSAAHALVLRAQGATGTQERDCTKAGWMLRRARSSKVTQAQWLHVWYIVFTYKTGWFSSGQCQCWSIFQHHGAYGKDYFLAIHGTGPFWDIATWNHIQLVQVYSLKGSPRMFHLVQIFKGSC